MTAKKFEIKHNFIWEADLTTRKNYQRKIAKLIRAAPKIIKILNIKKPPLVTITLFGESSYNLVANIVNISLFQLSYLEKNPYFKRKFSELEYYKPDIDLYVFAHEMAHHKQVENGQWDIRLTKKSWITDWRSKPKCKKIRETDKRGHHNKPSERDANKKSVKVIKELFRQKFY